MKSSKLVCRAAIFVQTESFMHKLRMEMRQPTVTVDAFGEIKRDQTECSCLLFVSVLLSPSLCMLIQLFSSISVNSGF